MATMLRLALECGVSFSIFASEVVPLRGLHSEASWAVRIHSQRRKSIRWTQVLTIKRAFSRVRSTYRPTSAQQHADKFYDNSPQWLDIHNKPVDSIWTDRAHRLTLVDGKAAVYRSYYGATSSVSRQTADLIDRSTGAQNTVDTVWTIINSLNALAALMELSPTHMAVVFDSEGLTFRHDVFPEYKLGRSPQPDTVTQALPVLRRLVTGMGMQAIEVTGVEADDVIATLTARAVAAGMQVCISSPDKDFNALLCPSVRLLKPQKRGPRTLVFSENDFISQNGLLPSQFLDMLALMGDRSDNVPGVPGIGEKTARLLLQEHGTLEALLERCTEVKRDKIREGLLERREILMNNKNLMRLRTTLPLHMVQHQAQDLALKPPSDGGQAFYSALDALNMNLNLPAMERLKKRMQNIWESMRYA